MPSQRHKYLTDHHCIYSDHPVEYACEYEGVTEDDMHVIWLILTLLYLLFYCRRYLSYLRCLLLYCGLCGSWAVIYLVLFEVTRCFSKVAGYIVHRNRAFRSLHLYELIKNEVKRSKYIYLTLSLCKFSYRWIWHGPFSSKLALLILWYQILRSQTITTLHSCPRQPNNKQCFQSFGRPCVTNTSQLQAVNYRFLSLNLVVFRFYED